MSLIGTRRKRLIADLGIFSNMKECISLGHFFRHNPDKCTEGYALIIGAEGTPYEGGFFFFKFDMGDSYPICSPKVETLTQGGDFRFNPNMYTNGKVCLSILGTWDGPSWSPTMSIRTILLSIQALVMCSNPINNEPGHNHSITSSTAVAYIDAIHAATVQYAIMNFLNPGGKAKIPVADYCRDYFYDIIRYYVTTNYTKYITMFGRYLLKYPTPTQIVHMFGSRIATNYATNLTQFERAYPTLKMSPEEVSNFVPSDASSTSSTLVTNTMDDKP